MNKKIDIYIRRRGAPRGFSVKWEYYLSTIGHKTCKQAKDYFCTVYSLSADQVKACFAQR